MRSTIPMKMMTSEAIRLQQVVMLQQYIIRLYRGEFVKLPRTPALFLSQDDIPSNCTAREKLVYLYFLRDKSLEISIDSIRVEQAFDALALAIYRKYYSSSPRLEQLIREYPIIADDDAWFE